MMINLIVDTNVLIYAMDKGSVHHQVANAILLNPNHNLFITTKNISEFFAVTSKLKIDLSSCLSFYAEVKSNFTILFPSLTSLLIFEKLVQQY
jgi:predicted nucleic acid-binding protein